MRPSLQRIIHSITGESDLKEQQLAVLLTFVEHLNRVKGASLGEIHSALAIVYMNPAQAQDDAINTHL